MPQLWGDVGGSGDDSVRDPMPEVSDGERVDVTAGSGIVVSSVITWLMLGLVAASIFVAVFVVVRHRATRTLCRSVSRHGPGTIADLSERTGMMFDLAETATWWLADRGVLVMVGTTDTGAPIFGFPDGGSTPEYD